MTFIAVGLSTADVATINHGCPLLVPDRKPTLPSRRSGRGGRGDGGEDGGDLSASWRATRRLPWKRGDQIQLGHRQFQILTSATLHTHVGMSVLTASLTSSRPIPENREPGDAKDARRGWDRVLGRRGGRRCPSLLAALGPSAVHGLRGSGSSSRGPYCTTDDMQPPIPPSSGGHPGGTCSGLLSPDIPPCQRLSRSSSPTSFFPASAEPASPARQFTMQRDLKLVPETRHGRGACLTRIYCLSPSTATTTKHWEALNCLQDHGSHAVRQVRGLGPSCRGG